VQLISTLPQSFENESTVIDALMIRTASDKIAEFSDILLMTRRRDDAATANFGNLPGQPGLFALRGR